MRESIAPSASIELRWVTEGDCDCGALRYFGEPSWNCRHWLECDWGRLDNPEADPERGLRHLILTTAGYVAELAKHTPRQAPRGGIHSVSSQGDRQFFHVDYEGRRWTWELFPTHWAHNADNHMRLLIGKWPD